MAQPAGEMKAEASDEPGNVEIVRSLIINMGKLIKAYEQLNKDLNPKKPLFGRQKEPDVQQSTLEAMKGAQSDFRKAFQAMEDASHIFFGDEIERALKTIGQQGELVISHIEKALSSQDRLQELGRLDPVSFIEHTHEWMLKIVRHFTEQGYQDIYKGSF